MKYVARKAREGVNVSAGHPLAEAANLALALSVVAAAIALLMFYLVDAMLLLVPPDAEASFFGSWVPADLRSISADDERTGALQELVERLQRHRPDNAYQFRVEVSNSESPNAMAFPGGLIIVTSGLLDEVESENELVFVLGHEFGHFRNRDHLRMLGRSAVLGMVISVLGGNSAAADLGITAARLASLSFNREQELAADEAALETLFDEYGHVGESSRFFSRLVATNGDVSTFSSYVSTHPSATDRIVALQAEAYRRGWSMTGPVTALAWQAAGDSAGE
jgi:Zn-dependent protease with chaperone function